MSAGAKKHWPKVCEQLKAAKIMTNIDVDALEMYCEAYATWHDAQRKVTEIGAVVKGKEGIPVMSPYFRVAEKSFQQMRQMLAEFGMTPSSRTKVGTNGDDGDDDF